MHRSKLLFAILCLSVFAAHELRSEEVELMGWGWAGNVVKSTEEVKEGTFSLRWDAGKEQNNRFAARAVETDWTRFQQLHFWAFSQKATGSVVSVCVYTTGAESGSHYVYVIPVDWTDWKEFNIDLKAFSKNRKPGGWNDIELVEFLPNFCGPSAPGTVLFINDLKLVE